MARALDHVMRRLYAELFRAIGPERYALWIHQSRPALLDEEVFVFHFASTYAKDKVEELLRNAVTQAAQRATNRNVRVQFTVESVSFRPSVTAEDDPRARREPTFSTFVTGPGNRMASTAARAFARGGPGAPRTLLIHARSGLGRTHLLRAIRTEVSSRGDLGVLFFTGEQFRRYSREASLGDRGEAFLKKCRSASTFLFDDLHLLCGRDEAQKALSQVLDGIQERGGRAALTCEKHPRALEGLSRALRARLRADVEVTLERPDTLTGVEFLKARAPSDVPLAVLEYIATHVQSSHTDQLHCLARLLEQPPPSPASARAAVAEFLNAWSRGLTYEDIVRAAAESFGVRVSEIYSLERSREAIEARQACFYLARKLLGRPFAQIGEHFGGRDHSTVHEACSKLERFRGAARERLKQLEQSLVPAP